jgi:hypothetical protein
MRATSLDMLHLHRWCAIMAGLHARACHMRVQRSIVACGGPCTLPKRMAPMGMAWHEGPAFGMRAADGAECSRMRLASAH